MTGDGLVRPLNAPSAGQLVPGVQPGTSGFGVVVAVAGGPGVDGAGDDRSLNRSRYNGCSGYNGYMNEVQRTVTAYASDHTWLKTRQREVSAQRDSWITMADLVHELIMAIVAAESGEGA